MARLCYICVSIKIRGGKGTVNLYLKALCPWEKRERVVDSASETGLVRLCGFDSRFSPQFNLENGMCAHKHDQSCPSCKKQNIAVLDDKLMECHDCGITFTRIAHSHDHSHDGKHDHEHDHGHPSKEELAVITETIQQIGRHLTLGAEAGIVGSVWHINEAVKQVFIKNIHKISSPVDLYDHNENFKRALNQLGIKLAWGHKASHSHKHAYVLKFSEEAGCVYTIMTDHDLGKLDNAFPWTSYDLFTEDIKSMKTDADKAVAQLEKKG